MFKLAKDLYDYRYMISSLVKRDIRGRYKGSVLGFLWNFVIPLTQMLVYTVVFSQLFHNSTENFAIFLITPMVSWIFFNEALSAGSGSIVDNSDMIGKIYFPRAVLPISTVLAKMINFFITLLIVMVIVAVLGYGFSFVALLYLIPVVIMLTVFITGVTLILSAFDAYFRDIQYIVTVMLTAMYWVTPIVYSRDQIDSEIIQAVLGINPMTYFAEAFRSIFYFKCGPEDMVLLACFILAIVFFMVGVMIFARLERDFAEVI